MALTSGTKLGPYEIQQMLGAGGMGEVYRARDVRLDRTVAVKVLASHLSSSPELKQRMEREARAISSLNHSNICHLYDIGSEDGTDFLVMEFLEGETLAQRIGKGPLPLNEILKIGIAVSEALSAAHRQGIVHRDLKPGNIMLTKSGAKLMDFGLAKSAAAGASSGISSAPLLSAARTMSGASPMSPLTTAGTLLGTIQYMAPEQIEGKEADARSDMFALGAVFYEMLTGARPFEGKSQISVASAILEKEPKPISVTQPLTPPAFEQIVTTCLAKNPEDRFQSAHDIVLQLKWIAQSGPTAAVRPAEKKGSNRELLVWRIVAVLALIVIALVLFWRGSRGAEQTTYFSAPLPFAARDVAVSPNGHTVAVVGRRESERSNALWTYEPGSQDSTRLANTEGVTYPFWSPDGQSIGFFADGKLKKVTLNGGQVQTLCDAQTGRGGAWNKDGVILFTPSGHLGVGLYKISASGGTPTQITTPDKSLTEDSHRWPVFLPDGIHYLYSAIHLSGRRDLSSVYEGSLNSNEKQLVTKSSANVAYVAPYLLFFRDQTLFAQHFDIKKFELTGEPAPLLTDVQYSPRISRAVFAASSTNLLVAQKTGDTGASQFLWFNRKGQEIGTALPPGIYGNMMLSPDDKSVALDLTDPSSQNTDIWIFNLETQSAKHLTYDPAIDSLPIWSPDGNRIIFTSNRGVTFDLYLKDTNGAQEEKHILQEGPDRFPWDWSRDGKYVLYQRDPDLWSLSMPELQPALFLKASATLKNGQFSPDGKWVAYSSNESGRWEIYVTSFPEAHGKWQISNSGGDQPRWRGDGKELFYLSNDGKLNAVPVKTGANFDAGTPVALFQANPRELVATSEQSSYDVTKDGQKFLINTQPKSATSPLSVVLDWTAKLK
jgi:serine/threonine protein kinase